MKKDIIAIATAAGVYLLLFAAVCFMWIGAEYLFENAVNFGRVDGIIAMYVAWTILVRVSNVGKKLQEKNNGQSVQV